MDEELKKEMELAFVKGDYAAALELSRKLDKQIAFVQKLKSIEVMIIIK